MIVDALRKLFAGMPTAVTTGLGIVAGTVLAVIANTLLNISSGAPWNSHVFLLALAGAVGKALMDGFGYLFMPKSGADTPDTASVGK